MQHAMKKFSFSFFSHAHKTIKSNSENCKMRTTSRVCFISQALDVKLAKALFYFCNSSHSHLFLKLK